ncbi:MAG: Hsp20/alpha crystallin family protein [Clostridia bacterium]|nr:Hsp20/alpha crystallin family protein [Clostridia bacterium]MBQ8469710.1 Hsp20/alpha crystallin family protein [Clostridia bacterium]
MFRNSNWLTTYDPFDPFTKLDKVFFGDPFFSNATTAVAAFGTDVTDEGDHYQLTADLPGFKKDDIEINVEDGILTISAERHEESEDTDKKGRYIRRERTYGSYKRSFDLSEVDDDNITAKYEDGVLTLSLPKKQVPEIESKKSITIE